MAMQFYASPEQIMRDRSELARKGIARGRSAVVVSYAGGVLFVAENLSSTLHKVSEIYDRIGFAAVGRYNEFENLRRAGVRMADLNGLSYDRRDVTGLALANSYAQILGAIFTEQSKPFEVEICVAEVGATPGEDSLYRCTYDGSVTDEPGRMAMGGQAEAISGVLKSHHRPDMSLGDAVKVAVQALSTVGGEGGAARTIAGHQLEVAILDRNRRGRTFRRITGAALTGLLDGDAAGEAVAEGDRAQTPTTPTEEGHKPTTSAGSADLEDKPGDKSDT
ncbi:proteasome subunit alpha [Verrucosispora sp. WMMA2044]|uniref:Proteasome subunit alpha n=1 Tax=Verrucosispora sioxanthis TaxID=2499994 RepID=A0A6M1KV95_9ACTN|nr:MULTISPECIES: proteasome subunit alpha [Micromonospora]NEE63915.1 proteasome subunit alpha [Verrucosispora sioxanthis]NGM13025.1 proteasome subunit alpha [Verrucosispora sioxanthis]WBB50988.1 proteasome subunit alpha [Verrucosispora sp. WMMA2044]